MYDLRPNLPNAPADIGDSGIPRYIHAANVGFRGHDVIGQYPNLLTVSLFRVLGEVEPHQVVVQVLGGDTVEPVHKPLQAAMIGVHMLDALLALLGLLRTHTDTLHAVLGGNPAVP